MDDRCRFAALRPGRSDALIAAEQRRRRAGTPMKRCTRYQVSLALLVCTGIAVACGCAWVADSADTAAYRVEHARGNPVLVTRLVCLGFDAESPQETTFRQAAARQAAVRGVEVRFRQSLDNVRAEAVIVDGADRNLIEPLGVDPPVPTFILSGHDAADRRANACLVLPHRPTADDYGEAGRRAVDAATDFLRGLTPPPVIRIGAPEDDADHPRPGSDAQRLNSRLRTTTSPPARTADASGVAPEAPEREPERTR